MELNVGGCGSGKSHNMQTQVGAAVRAKEWANARFVVFDTCGDWKGGGAGRRGVPRLRIATVDTIAQLERALEAGERYIRFVPREEDAETDPKKARWFSLCGALVNTCLDARRVVMVIPELHESCPEGKGLHPAWVRLAHAYRHRDCLVWADTQQATYIKKEVFKCFNVVRVFATTRDDIKYLAPKLGDRIVPLCERVVEEVVDASGACVNPGWHVRCVRMRDDLACVVDPRGIAR